MKLALVCEVLYPPFDEGVRILAMMLARSLSTRAEVVAFSQKPAEIDGVDVHPVLDNKWFVSRRLSRLMGEFKPDAVLYIPWTSLTERTMIRCRVLSRHGSGAPVAVLAVQPRHPGLFMRLAGFLGRPDGILSLGPGTDEQAERLGITSLRVHAGVDLGRFKPVSAQFKHDLRRRAGIDTEAHVVLHVGHLKESRNIGVLESIAGIDGVVPMLVASTSTRADADARRRLENAGVILMANHQDRIEFAYQLADTYIFPVKSPLDAIEQPLSVLEAAGCGLSVISTPFGGLPELLGPESGEGIIWDEEPEHFPGLIAERITPNGHMESASRRRVEGLSWEMAAGLVISSLDALVGGRS